MRGVLQAVDRRGAVLVAQAALQRGLGRLVGQQADVGAQGVQAVVGVHVAVDGAAGVGVAGAGEAALGAEDAGDDRARAGPDAADAVVAGHDASYGFWTQYVIMGFPRQRQEKNPKNAPFQTAESVRQFRKEKSPISFEIEDYWSE